MPKSQKQLDKEAQDSWILAHGGINAVRFHESDSQMEQRREKQMLTYLETRFDGSDDY